jgi:hypothetical protein
MKRLAVMIGLGFFLVMPSSLWAQRFLENHVEAGVYANYFRFSPGDPSDNYVGVGGRLGFNVQRHLALEGEMDYDFARNYTTIYTNGVKTSFAKTSIRPITGLFGPKLQFGTSRFRVFLDGKVGFIDFSTSTSGVVSGVMFANAVNGVGGSGTYPAFYPGGGMEAFFGPLGVRVDVGDEIYLNNGTHHDLRVTIGPEIRF